jgi:predicted metal-dependent enzyme (double-stranded beta helix superfamily)
MAGEYGFQDLIADLTQITNSTSAPRQIIDAAKPLLARFVSDRKCIEPHYKQRGAASYGRYMLHRAPRFNITSVVWGPGDMAKAHNHGTWGLVGVVENELQETRFRRLDDGSKEGVADLEFVAVNRNEAGMVSTLHAPDDDIHAMLNVTRKNTVEVHVYGKDLANLQRLQFDVEEKRVKYFTSPKYDNC